MTHSHEALTNFYTLLIVDDDEFDRQAAIRAIRAAKIVADIFEANDCATALKLISHHTFDCLFLDYQLSDGDGLALLKTIRSQGIDTPIVMLTGHGDEQLAVELMKAGASDYLAKSRLSPEELARSLRQTLRTHKAEQYARVTAQQLQESELLVLEIANTAPALLWMSDAEGHCTFFNESWLEFTGREMAQEMGIGWEELIHPEDFAACVRTFEDARSDQRGFRMEYRLRRADGQYRWLLDTATPRKSVEGTLIGYIGSAINITDRKQAEQALFEKQLYIEKLNIRLRFAMFETHHRVKNNLQMIAAMLDMLIMENPERIPTTTLKQLAHHIHILAVVQDLLTRQAKIDGQADHVSVHKVLNVLLPMLQKTAGSRKLSFHVEAVEMPTNQGTSLAIIANELISNALKYGKTTVHMALTLQNSFVLLEVSDDGPGFPPDFNPGESAKMGLELVQSLTRLDLHGETCYENTPNGGGRVRITVPLPARETTAHHA